tara:strand:- start:54 stop:533 length:480 start_codon:yes stop_codon:yes gene_type:complete
MHIGTNFKKLDISQEKDTQKIAEKFSRYLQKGDIIYINGEIGVGKTTFIRYLINFIQVKNNEKVLEIPSPTFNIVHEYEVKDFTILHYDLYRIKDPKELKEIGILEKNKDSLIFVEWPELIKKKDSKSISLEFLYDQNLKKRSLKIISNGNKKLLNEFK